MTPPYGSDRPRMTRAPSAATSWENSAVSRLLPIPAGPKSVTRCGRHSPVTRAQMFRSASSSDSRPSIGTCPDARSPGAPRAATARQTRTGSCLPFATTASASS